MDKLIVLQVIYEEFKKKGGEIELKPLLPGAIELPNDKYRLRISQLEDKLSISENKLSISENKLTPNTKIRLGYWKGISRNY